MITKFRTAGSLGLVLGAALVLGCATYPVNVEKTTPEDPIIMKGKQLKVVPTRVMFLSNKEAKCPTRCSATVEKESYNKLVTRIEQRMQERGYSLISGAIVSRIEDKLLGGEQREEWDRTEKALLLGKDTGAEAIFVVRTLYIDQKARWLLKETRTNEFLERPELTVAKTIKEWRRGGKPSTGWLAVPIFGWIYYYIVNAPPIGYEFPVWEAVVRARMLDLDGNVLWSASKMVRSTDIMPNDWRARLESTHPWTRVVTSYGKKDQNFDYSTLYDDQELQTKTLSKIIDSLIAQLPKPS